MSDKSVNINILHRYSYENFWLMFHGAEINPKDVKTHTAAGLFNKFHKQLPNKDKSTDTIVHNFTYKDFQVNTTFKTSPSYEMHHATNDKQSLNVFNLNLHYFETAQLDIALPPLAYFQDDITNNIIPQLNRWYEEGFNVALMINSWEPFVGFESNFQRGTTDLSNSILLNLHPNIHLFTDSLMSNEKLETIYKVKKDNRYDCYSQFINSVFWPSTHFHREFFHFHRFFKKLDRNDVKYKFHYSTRRWYKDKAEVAKNLINLNVKEIGVTMSGGFDDWKEMSCSDESFWNEKSTHYEELRNYFKSNPENVLSKRGYNLEDFGGEWLDDNSREAMWNMLPLSNITILHEHKNHQSERMILHIILGKPFIPVYYKSFNTLKQIIESGGIKVPNPPFKEGYETINEIMWNIRNWTKEDKWIPFRDSMYDWVYELRESLIEYMNKNNSMLNHIINDVDSFTNNEELK